MARQHGGFEPPGEERDWTDEPTWQRPICEMVLRLRERAEYALAAELAAMLSVLSERHDRAG